MDHRSRFRENDDLPLRPGPVIKKTPPFSGARALITRKIMRSRDAQCITGKDLKSASPLFTEKRVEKTMRSGALLTMRQTLSRVFDIPS